MWQKQAVICCSKLICREGYNEGLEEGLEQGAQQKAVEAALVLIKDFKADPKLAAEKMNAPLDKVLEALKQKESVCI